MPDLSIESKYNEKLVCGVDEVGRGCLAGDVYAAAVIIPDTFPNDILEQLKDSKKLSAKKREFLSEEIKKHAIFSIEKATVKEIDSINILNAALLAMERAIKSLDKKPDVCLIDGNKAPHLPEFTVETVIKGNSISCSIAAASIIAKVERDRVMTELASKHPHYMWESNAGYGTKAHLEAIKEYGITPMHRKSFSPCK